MEHRLDNPMKHKKRIWSLRLLDWREWQISSRAYGVTENMACAEPRAANWQTVARPASAGAFIKRRFRCPRQQLIEVAYWLGIGMQANGTSLTYRQFRKNYSFESLGLFRVVQWASLATDMSDPPNLI